MAAIGLGTQLGQWVISSPKPLGTGGNGEVWQARSCDGRTGAIKILTRRGGPASRYRLGRFRDEIGFLLAHPNTPGILPILDSHLSDDPSQPSWYAMPVAVPIRQCLGSDPEPAIVVAAIAEIAGTLATLAAKGVGHRDIKPDNLFRLDDHWVIGDFGLVTYPQKDPRTEHGRKLGPVDFMAPEMREQADTATAEPADVWAVAKTLWVLLTGQSLPLPGTHQPADPGHALEQRITFRYSAALDLLLEAATLTDPRARVTLAAMTRELRACTAPPPEATPAASLEALHARIAALTATARVSADGTRARQESFDAAWGRLEHIVTDVGRQLASQLTFDLRENESGYRAAALLDRAPHNPHYVRDSASLLLPPGQPWPAVEVGVAAAIRILSADDPAEIAVTLQVRELFDHGSMHEVNDIWTETYDAIPLGSAQLTVTLDEIRAGLTSAFATVMRGAISVLDKRPNGSDSRPR